MMLVIVNDSDYDDANYMRAPALDVYDIRFLIWYRWSVWYFCSVGQGISNQRVSDCINDDSDDDSYDVDVDDDDDVDDDSYDVDDDNDGDRNDDVEMMMMIIIIAINITTITAITFVINGDDNYYYYDLMDYFDSHYILLHCCLQ